MASGLKRPAYVSGSEYTSDEDIDYIPLNKRLRVSKHQTEGTINRFETEHESRKQCTTKNAIIARRNRIKKKMYIENLENDVKKLKNTKDKLYSIVNNQSFVISQLRKEIRYVKSILANSSDLSKLIKNITDSTGLSVTTSLDKTLTMTSNCVSKLKPMLGSKILSSTEACIDEDYGIPTADVNLSDFELPLDIDIPFQDVLDYSDETSTENVSEVQSSKTPLFENVWNDHNYTNMENDVGVCLHVSSHRVSLEFCPSCSESAIQSWKSQD